MTHRNLTFLPLLVLAAISASGCVAAAIPVLASGALIGSRAKQESAATASNTPVVADNPAPVALTSQPAPVPTVTVAPAPPTPAAPPPTENLIKANPARPAQFGFAQFVRYGREAAAADAPISAMLSDPFALDGARRRCAAGEQPVALIDLDPAGGVLAPPTSAQKEPGLGLGLAVLREAGVVIAWITDLPVTESGVLRTTLEQAGLDPRGEDIISLRLNDDDRMQVRRESLGANACIIAIAGDERPDFDERFRYLRTPDAGSALEPLIGNGWFLIENIFPAATPNERQQGQ